MPKKLPPGASLSDRLRHWTDRSAGPDSCWPWLGTRCREYGSMTVEGRSHPAHRVVLHVETGITLATALVARHSCDNPICCNPDHLEWGTIAENQSDMAARGRSTAGERHPNAKLTAREVKVIRERRAAGEKAKSISADFEISTAQVYDIALRKSWKWL